MQQYTTYKIQRSSFLREKKETKKRKKTLEWIYWNRKKEFTISNLLFNFWGVSITKSPAIRHILNEFDALTEKKVQGFHILGRENSRIFLNPKSWGMTV